MASRFRVFLAVAASLLLAPADRVSAQPQKFDALIGTWVLNIPQSQVSPVPKSQVRTFDYTHDGMVLCTLRSENANGSRSFFHWFTNLDGVQHPEFNRAAGAASTTTIALKKVDDRTVEIQGVTMSNGKVHLTGTASVSADGRTLTWKTKNIDPQGKELVQVRIYEKE
jgi:hypothetical protein